MQLLTARNYVWRSARTSRVFVSECLANSPTIFAHLRVNGSPKLTLNAMPDVLLRWGACIV